MAVILEGPDRAGKTTLAEALRARYRAEIRHLGGSEYLDAVLIRHWDKVEAAMRLEPRATIYDRMVIGSLVYAFKKDRHNVAPITSGEYLDWLDWMAEKHNVLVCCLPPLSVLMERIKVGEDYITQEDMITVHRRYAHIFHGFTDPPPNFPVLFYDSSVTSPEDFIERQATIFGGALQ